MSETPAQAFHERASAFASAAQDLMGAVEELRTLVARDDAGELVDFTKPLIEAVVAQTSVLVLLGGMVEALGAEVFSG